MDKRFNMGARVRAPDGRKTGEIVGFDGSDASRPLVDYGEPGGAPEPIEADRLEKCWKDACTAAWHEVRPRDEYVLGSAGSFITGCSKCGRADEECFRETPYHPQWEWCRNCNSSDHMKIMMKADLADIWHPLWRKLGYEIKGEDF